MWHFRALALALALPRSLSLSLSLWPFPGDLEGELKKVVTNQNGNDEMKVDLRWRRKPRNGFRSPERGRGRRREKNVLANQRHQGFKISSSTCAGDDLENYKRCERTRALDRINAAKRNERCHTLLIISNRMPLHKVCISAWFAGTGLTSQLGGIWTFPTANASSKAPLEFRLKGWGRKRGWGVEGVGLGGLGEPN